LRDPIRLAVSVEHRLVTDRQTDRHTTTACTALAWRRGVKMINSLLLLLLLFNKKMIEVRQK